MKMRIKQVLIAAALSGAASVGTVQAAPVLSPVKPADPIVIYDTPTLLPDAPGGGGAVPEPAVWAMMIVGLGVIGTALRRRVARAV